jgi:hypothetical protein
MIGIGTIGGKAAGMLIARAIVRRDRPSCTGGSRRTTPSTSAARSSIPSSCDQRAVVGAPPPARSRRLPAGARRRRGRKRAHPARTLPGRDAAPVRGMLDYFGEWPFIVRSSSRLEDRYGNAFAGQYDSVFCANRGTREERLADLLERGAPSLCEHAVGRGAALPQAPRPARRARADGLADHARIGNCRRPLLLPARRRRRPVGQSLSAGIRAST